MDQWLPRILTAIAGYLIGSFPTGVFLSKYKYRIDVREMGSGNIGATNVTRVFGWSAGALVFLIDFLKGLVPMMMIYSLVEKDPWITAFAGVGLIVGHCFSFFLGFDGGKGVATSFGVLCIVNWVGALVTLVGYVLGIASTRISAVGSLLGVLVLLSYTLVGDLEEPVKVLFFIISVLIIVRHKPNIERLLSNFKENPNEEENESVDRPTSD